MELNQSGFLEDILVPRETWTNLGNNGVSDFFPNEWGLGSLDQIPILPSSNPSFLDLISQPSFECPSIYSPDESYHFPEDGFIVQRDNYPSAAGDNDRDPCLVISDDQHESKISCCKMEMEQISGDVNQVFDRRFCGLEKKGKSKKLKGQPSKNLMAERRRRKRLNDRLSMLRSIVPKISKMDKTSILGDAIDYIKELLERINKLQEDDQEKYTNQMKLIGNLRQLKTNETLVRNSAKFEVERRDCSTLIDICCAAKPGLLLSTVSTLEALGLEIQHCVISCFNDFSSQASCLEVAEQRELINSEGMKEALSRNAGYGGRCL